MRPANDTRHPSFRSRGGPDRGKGFFAIKDHQVAWAKRHGIRLNHRNRVTEPDLNLYKPLRADTKAALEAGDGKELEDKFLAVYSSCALAVNTFDYWHDPGRVLGSCFGLSGPLRVRFETKHPIFNSAKATPPNVDVELNGSDGNVVIECKATEPFVRYQKTDEPFSPAYFKTQNSAIWQSMTATRLFAERINRNFLETTRSSGEQIAQNEGEYTRLSPEQLVKTALGCRRTFGSNCKLVYVWYEPKGRDCAEECRVLREELAQFQKDTSGEISLAAMTWTALWRRLEGRARPEDGSYIEWLRDRYFSD